MHQIILQMQLHEQNRQLAQEMYMQNMLEAKEFRQTANDKLNISPD
jgi:hypothetical protein